MVAAGGGVGTAAADAEVGEAASALEHASRT